MCQVVDEKVVKSDSQPLCAMICVYEHVSNSLLGQRLYTQPCEFGGTTYTHSFSNTHIQCPM